MSPSDPTCVGCLASIAAIAATLTGRPRPNPALDAALREYDAHWDEHHYHLRAVVA